MPELPNMSALADRASVYRVCIDGTLVNLGETIAQIYQILTDTEARVQQLQTLLARNLVFDWGSAEEAAEALGGLPEVFWLVEQFHLSRPGHTFFGEPS
ncbi:hypothetical protein [Tabrizicola fusiformis]|uniref:hypothetical protein n=1 Tax=Tabrizicola sp. SY72 TaxID=2741673 RepID=UPI0015725EF0|nr:hypothetical protein [Tabrizicola sp. SY72]NTT88239.1 hypothetical protein [Tabrizicola sp. SY72]